MDYRDLIASAKAKSEIARSNYGRNNFTVDASSLSAGNPYIEQMRLARNKTDYKRLQTQAIQWEANIAKNTIDMANQRALRDEEREYNDYSSQVGRMRKAGLNPDILLSDGAGSGVGSGGSVSAPQLSDTDLTDLSTPIETAGAVSGVMSGVGSFVSGIAEGIDTITDVVGKIANFDSVFRTGRAMADQEENKADESKSTTLANKFSSTLGIARDVARVYPYAKGEDGTAIVPTLEELGTFLQDFGIQGLSDSAPLIHKVMSNPEFSALADSFINEANFQKGQAFGRTLQFQKDFAQMSAKNELAAQESAYYLNLVEGSVNKLLSESDIASQTVDNMESEQEVLASDLSNRKESFDLQRLAIKDSMRAFLNSMNVRRTELQKLYERRDDILKNWRSFANTKEGQNELALLDLNIHELEMAGANDIASLCKVFSSASKRLQELRSLGLYGTGYVSDGKYLNYGSVLPSDWTQKDRNFSNWLNFTWNDYYQDPDRWGKVIDSSIDGLFTGLGIGAGLYAGTRSKTGTSNKTITHKPLKGGGYSEVIKERTLTR